MPDTVLQEDITADTLLTALAENGAALARLCQLHPAFDPATGRSMGVPDHASLGDMARAADLPLPAVLAAARGVVAVPQLCGCHGKKEKGDGASCGG